MATTRDVLERALEIIRDEGWIQGSTYRQGQGRCVLGALIAGEIQTGYLNRSDYADAHLEAIRLVRQAAELRGPRDLIGDWNDHPDRTKDEVIEVLKEAIVAAPLEVG